MLFRSPDIVLNYFIKPVIFGSLAAKWAGVPYRIAMIEGLGFIFTPGPTGFSLARRVLKRLVMLLYKLGLSCADKVIFLNPDDQNEFIAAHLLPPSKTFLLGGIGVDLNKWPFTPPVVESLTFLMVARLLRERRRGGLRCRVRRAPSRRRTRFRSSRASSRCPVRPWLPRR